MSDVQDARRMIRDARARMTVARHGVWASRGANAAGPHQQSWTRREQREKGAAGAMTGVEPEDAAEFARRHAGELDSRLTSAQRDLLGRVIAKRIERGAKLEAIERAAVHALPELDAKRVRRLARDEAMRALAWEALRTLRARGETHVALSAAPDACPACRAANGVYAIAEVPALPMAECTHAGGCRCLYRAASEVEATASSAGTDERGTPAPGLAQEANPPQPARQWYRPRPPRPHGPRWSEDERAQRRPRGTGSPRRPTK